MCTVHAPFLTFRHRASQTQSRKLVIAKSAARDLIDGCSFQREKVISRHTTLLVESDSGLSQIIQHIESVRAINHSRPKISHFKRLLVCKSAYMSQLHGEKCKALDEIMKQKLDSVCIDGWISIQVLVSWWNQPHAAESAFICPEKLSWHFKQSVRVCRNLRQQLAPSQFSPAPNHAAAFLCN